MKTVAVIGLGIMGHGVADNFLKHGHKVVVWNRSPERARDLVKRGAVLATSPSDAARQAELVFEVTANDESSRAVWTGGNGILAAARPGQALFTCATLSVAWVEELGKLCAGHSLTFFDAPMTGGRVAAESGQLTLLAGGDEAELETVRSELASIAKEVKHFGPVGSGTKYKLVLNTLQAIHLAGFGEVMRLAKAAGLNPDKVGPALVERPGGVMTGIAWNGYQQYPAPLTFSVEWITKDLGYTSKMSAGSVHPLLDDVLTIYKKAVSDGQKDADWTIINPPKP